MKSPALILCALLVFLGKGEAAVGIVAAENFYGDVAQQLSDERVTSILTNPDQDPHLFTANVDTAKAVADAQVVIDNGIDYDPWMEQMLAAHPNAQRVMINVAQLLHAKAGDNPHLWYRPDAIATLARKLAEVLTAKNPAQAKSYQAHLDRFLASLQPLDAKIAVLKGKYAGTDVVATEPVFGYMADALGFKMHAMGFQNHVMNNVEPTARESEEFETLLRSKKVKILFYNRQASNPVAARMQEIAHRSGVLVVGVTETEPAGTTYVAWMLSQLDDVEKALSRS